MWDLDSLVAIDIHTHATLPEAPTRRKTLSARR